MISHDIYKIVHLVGIMLVFFYYGALIYHYSNGGSRELAARKHLSMWHGIGMFVILVGGFGMLARLGVEWPFPLWAFLKIGIWIVLGGLVALVRRFPQHGRHYFKLCLLLGGLAAYAAIYKPGA